MSISGVPISGETVSGTPGAFTPALTNPLFVSTTTGMMIGDTVEIMLDNGELFRTTISHIPNFGQINITQPLPFRASAGNIVIDLTQSNNVLPVTSSDIT